MSDSDASTVTQVSERKPTKREAQKKHVFQNGTEKSLNENGCVPETFANGNFHSHSNDPSTKLHEARHSHENGTSEHCPIIVRALRVVFYSSVAALLVLAYIMCPSRKYIIDALIEAGVFKPDFNDFGGREKYLTMWNAWIHCGFYLISAIYEIKCLFSRRSQGHSGINRILELIRFSLVIPLSLFVVISFWSIYLIDREKIYPKRNDTLIPPWTNFVFHLWVLPLALVDLFLLGPHRCPSKRQSALICGALLCIYSLWSFIARFVSGQFPYKLLDVLSPPIRFVAISFFISLGMVFWNIGVSLSPTKGLIASLLKQPQQKHQKKN